MKKILKQPFGFTLAELAIAMAVLSALAAYTAPDYSKVINKAKEVTCLTQRRALEHAEMLYLVEHNYRQSATLEELLNEKYIDILPRCQDGGKYYWKALTPRPVLCCNVHDGLKDAGKKEASK